MVLSRYTLIIKNLQRLCNHAVSHAHTNQANISGIAAVGDRRWQIRLHGTQFRLTLLHHAGAVSGICGNLSKLIVFVSGYQRHTSWRSCRCKSRHPVIGKCIALIGFHGCKCVGIQAITTIDFDLLRVDRINGGKVL